MHTLGDVITALIMLAALIVVPYKLAKAWLWPALMSRSEGARNENGAHGDTCINTSIPDTKAIPPADRDIMLDQWLVAMTLAMDDRGKEVFTATKIAAAIGGNHNQTMARIKEVRTGKAPQFRQDDGSTAPAEYPVTKGA